MRVWIVQTGEPLPIDRAGTRLWRSGLLAVTLKARGHEVVWWASTFRHADHTHRTKGEHHEVWEGIELALIPSPGYARNISAARLWDHHRLGRELKAAILKSARPDVIHCGFPTIETCEVMVNYGREQRVPTVIDVRDMWPEAFLDAVSPVARPLARPFLGYLDERCRKMFSRADVIHGHTPYFRDYGLEKAGRSAGCHDRSYPFGYPATPPEESLLRQAEAFWEELGIQSRDGWLTICFLGNLNSERKEIEFDTSLNAIRCLAERGVPVRIVYCGAGHIADRIREGTHDIRRHVLTPGFMNAPQIWSLMRRSHLGLLPYLPARDFVGSMPNKAIEYLSGGLPVLTSLTEGYMFQELSESDCVVPYRSGDASGLARILQAMRPGDSEVERLSTSARQLFEHRFTAEVVYEDLAGCLEQVAATGSVEPR